MTVTEEHIKNSKKTHDFGTGEATYFDITSLEDAGVDIGRLPFSIRVLLENALRNHDGRLITTDDINTLVNWPQGQGDTEIPYMPSRVVLQDFTGVPLIVDIADLREAVSEQGGDPSKVNPLIPTDLIVDHSVQVDYYGTEDSLEKNIAKEYERNLERYKVLKWAKNSFDNMQIVPPGNGIVHQVNLEYLARVVEQREVNGEVQVFPDTCVGTDSHTPMVNGVAVVGFGVGGIEAEAVMLGQPYYMPLPEVVGVKLTGSLSEGVTATDLVLTVTRMLRDEGVVGKFVEFYGPGLSSLSVPDRATISNMSPEHGSTVVFFPVDDKTCDYLKLTGRDENKIEMIENYAKKLNMYRQDEADPEYSVNLELDLTDVVPTVAGPLNPDEKIAVANLRTDLQGFIDDHAENRSKPIMLNDDASGTKADTEDGVSELLEFRDGSKGKLRDGDIVIAAITSCTNTSNPSVMVGAGLLAKKAVEKGLEVPSYVKTSFAPGSKVVTDYLNRLELTPYLEALKFHTVGYGCTTCIGNSGPLDAEIDEAIRQHDLYVTSVLSGNRNFGGRVHNLTRGNFLCSPMLVVAYALAGTTLINLNEDPIATNQNGEEIYLKDIWPSTEEIHNAIQEAVTPDLFEDEYGKIMEGDKNWNDISVEGSTLYPWEEDSTYIRRPPYFSSYQPGEVVGSDIEDARVLVKVGDKLSTDHISPAGAIAKASPAGKYMQEELGIAPKDFNTYGSRRGNHEIMQRGTFANVRLHNQLAKEDGEIKEGWWTRKYPEDELMPVWNAAVEYMEDDTPVIVLGGHQYGQGSSRDWGAKGPLLQGVVAKIVKDYERIHRANLIGMGILPLTFEDGEDANTLGLDGTEKYTIRGIGPDLKPHQKLEVTALADDGSTTEFNAIVQLNSDIEVEYYLAGGILPYVATRILKDQGKIQ